MAAAICCICSLPGEARSSDADWMAPYATASRPARITRIRTGLIVLAPLASLLAPIAALARMSGAETGPNPSWVDEAPRQAPQKSAETAKRRRLTQQRSEERRVGKE